MPGGSDIWREFSCKLRFVSFSHGAEDIDLGAASDRGAQLHELVKGRYNMEVMCYIHTRAV